MAINLATRYANKIEEAFTLDSLVFGKGTATYDFSGVKTVKSLSPQTVDVVDYDITKTDGSRFGSLTEMQDVENEYTVSQDKAFNLSIDKGNNENQLHLKGAGKMLKKQVREKIIPLMDTYALKQYATATGVLSAVDGTLTSDNIVEKIADSITAMVNEKVPVDGLIGWIKASDYEKLILTNKIIYLEKIGSDAFSKGYVGTCQGINFVRLPDTYFPTNVNFIVAKKSVLMPVKKITTLRILKEHPYVDGSVLQGRYMYDAFVLRQKANGVYVSKSSETA